MKYKLIPISLLALTQVVGCASTDIIDETICFDSQGSPIGCSELNSSGNNLALNVVNPNTEYLTSTLQDKSLFNSKVNFQVLNEYVEQMAMKLKESSGHYLIKTPIAVTSIVNLDGTLKSTNLLGNQISEYFINELKNIGFQVNDHKVTGFIQITTNGDLAMSRNILELKENLDIGNILTGTMIQNERGIIVNIRIISLFNNGVVASTTKLIPNLVVNRF